MITITKEGYQTECSYTESVQLLTSVILDLSNKVTEQAIKDGHPEFRNDLYDYLNEYFSSILSKYQPEKLPHDIDPEVLMALEDTMINDELSKLKANNPRLYKKRIKEIKKLKDELHWKQNKKQPTTKPRQNRKRLSHLSPVLRPDEKGNIV
jgi:hypothetical protein